MSYGVRETKKAQTKLDCINAAYEITKSVPFKDLMVKDIISRVGITEMTFFNYFSKKEDIILYWMEIWKLHSMVSQRLSDRHGEEGIRQIFYDTAKQANEHPSLMNMIMSYILSLDSKPVQVELEPAFRHLKYPEYEAVVDLEIVGVDEIMLEHISELKCKNPKDLLRLLLTSFYGDAFQAHMRGEDLHELYRNSLDSIFKRSP